MLDPTIERLVIETVNRVLEAREKTLLEPRAVSVKQAAKMFGSSQTLIRESIASGAIPAFRIGKAVRIPLAAITEIIASAK